MVLIIVNPSVIGKSFCNFVTRNEKTMSEKELDERVQRAVDNFMAGYGCCQSVVAAFADLYGLDEGKSACYKVVQELLAQSTAENGSLICAEILGINGYEKAPDSYIASARTAEYYKTRPCAAKVESAAKIFANYLARKNSQT